MTDSKINVAILGIGNCASSFVQGLQYYKNEQDENGLISDVIGGYRVSDIEVVCAFDINKSKVGKDLSQAIFEEPNNTVKFAEVPNLGVNVKPGKVLDGIGKFVEEIIDPTEDSENIIRAGPSIGHCWFPVFEEKVCSTVWRLYFRGAVTSATTVAMISHCRSAF